MSEPIPPSEITGTFELVPLDELFLNHDEFSSDPTSTLEATKLTARFLDCGEFKAAFRDGALRWTADGETPWGQEGTDNYLAVFVRPGVFAVTVDRLGGRASALAVLDTTLGRLTIVLTELVGPDEDVRERTRVFNAALQRAEPPPLERSADLAGLRIHYRYSTTHAFEHIYVDDAHYVWHGIEGPEAGMGGFEPAEAYRLADQLYLFTWHERASPFNGTIIIDLVQNRSTGRLFGWHLDQHRAISVQTGAVATVLNRTSFDGL